MMHKTSTLACLSLLSISLLAGCLQPGGTSTSTSETGEAASEPAQLVLTSAPETEPASPPSEEPTFVLPAPLKFSLQVGQSSVELREYALGLTTEDLNNEAVLAPVYAVLFDRFWQPSIMAASDEKSPAETRQLLNSWGYHCEDDGLYKDGQLLVAMQPCDAGAASVNRSRTDFVLFLPVRSMAEGWLVRRESVDEDWDRQWHFWVTPKYIGDDLFVLDHNFGENGAELVVQVNDQTVFTQALQGMGECLGKGLQVWDDSHWGLNTEGDVIIDGELVGRQQGFREAFGLYVLNGKPVYFALQDERPVLVMGGQVVPLEYGEIIHTCQAVYQAIFLPLDMRSDSHLLWFFARRGELWYYVEMEVR